MKKLVIIMLISVVFVCGCGSVEPKASVGKQKQIDDLFKKLKNAYYHQKDFERAEKLADEIIALEPDNKEALEWKKEARAKKNKRMKAKQPTPLSH